MMNNYREQAEALWQQAREALQAHDFTRALTVADRLEVLAPPPWSAIGRVRHAAGDNAGATRAYQMHLKQIPSDLHALLMLGRLNAERGDDKAANAAYQAALNVARQPGFVVPADLRSAVEEAQQFLMQATARFTQHLDAILTQCTADQPGDGSRISHAIDLLLGKTQVYLQQPSMFYFPGLAQRAFWERSEFEWVAAMEAAAPDIRQEVEAYIRQGTEFSPYVQQAPGRPAPANHLLDDPSWGALHLFQNGEPTALSTYFPATMKALSAVPMPKIAGRSPMALFSSLRPDTHIKPHHGLLNTRLICHLPLIVPEGCAIRVGSETRAWHDGEMLLFDDSVEHEAWNRGNALRVILLFEIWKPEITAEERAALTQIFGAIDSYGMGNGGED